MKTALIIGLGWQWKKYIEYFLKNDYQIAWVCQSIDTKNSISKKYNIPVFLETSQLKINTFDIIVVAIPPENQWLVALNILGNWFVWKLIIELPVSWNQEEISLLKNYENVFFFLEEYYTLLAKFLRKVWASDIDDVLIDVYTHRDDFENIQAKEVTYIHIKNNFLWTWIPETKLHYSFNFHDREDIFYEIRFNYKGTKIKYKFDVVKSLEIWDKIFHDDYNFDKVLKELLVEENNFNKYYK